MKRQRWKRFLAAILTTVMCLGEVGGTGMKVFAQDDIPSTEEAVSEDDAASENEAVSEEEPGLETPAEEPADTPKEEQEEGSEEEPDADGDTYALWVGGVQVTDKNKDDIPGVTGGKASYDPVTKTLEFQNAVVETYYAEGADRNDAIAAWNDDLTIRGKLTIVKGTGAYGIVADGNLRLEDADITVPEAEYSAIRVMKGLEIVRSSLNVKSADEYAVWVNGDVTLDDSYIKAEGTSFGFLCQGKINPANKHEVLQPAGAEIDKYGQIARGGADSRVIEIVRDYEVYVGETPVTKLNNRNVLGDGKVSYDPEKNTLRLEGAEITSVSVQGKNKYKTNIYSASDLRIEGSVKMSAEANRWIWSAGSLTLDAEIEGTKAVTLVYAGESMQVIGGEIKGTSQRGGLTANQELTIDGGNITLTVGESGLYTVMGAVVINGGDIKLSCPEDSHAVVAGSGRGKFTMNGGRLYAKTDNVGALWAGELSITKNDMRILLPEGGYEKGGSIIDPKTGNSARELLICKKGTQDCTVSFDMGGHGTQIPPKTVKDGTVLSRPDDPSATGWIFAGWYSDDRYKSKFDFTKEILKDTTIYAKWIENKESYELWLGNKLVGGDNCLDIFKDGKASYDPTTNTLTLSGYTGAYSAGQIADFVPYSEQAGGYKPLIYAKQDLTIKGSATLTSSSGANIGIMSEQGKLSIDADLKLNIENETDGGAYGLYCQAKDLNIAGGSVEVNAGGGANAVGLAVGNADVVIDGGNVKTTGTMVGVFTMGGNVVLGGGSLEAVGTGSESIGVANFAGTVTLNAGTLKAKGVKAAAVFTTMVKDEDYFETKPGDVKILKDPGMGANTFFEADGTTIAKEVELTRKMFTVTFDLGGKTVYDGTAPEPQKVYAGKTAHKPEDPVAEGFAFKGWYKDQACTEEFSFLGTDITEDITLYAKWAEGFTVEFNTGYDDVDEPFAQSVEEGNTVERPGDPVAEGRKFLGWFLSLEDTEPYDFDTPVTKSFTLYAKWEKEKRTVSFDANGHGAAPAAITVDYGDVPEAPEEPKAEGYKFMGWYLDKECKALYDFGQPVTEDLTLYAKWVDAATKTWTVSFSLNGMAGTAPAAQTVEDGGLAIRPEDPVVPGRTFAGWYTGKSCKDEELFSFATPITADITLYAKWVGGGEEIPGFTVWFVGCAPGPEYGSLAYNSVNGHYEVAYTSFAMKPAVEVRGADGVILTEGTDYTVKYSNNVNVSTKKAAKVTVKGKGNFSGSKELEFYILPADLSILKGKLIVVPQQYAKDGKPVAELYYGTYKLKAKDVELPKEKITEAKELEIKGKGNFCGSIKEVFTPISKADLKKSTLKITLSAKTVVFNGMEQRPEVTVTASDGTKLEETTDYVVSYSHNCNAGKAAVVVEGRGKYYGGASATFTIKPDTTSVIAVKSEGKVLHNPAGATVSLLVTAGDRILTEGIDYTVKYSNNKKVGTGQALISFIGNYKGQKAKKQSFTIEAAPFLWAEFFVGSMTYTKPGKFFSKVYVTDGDVQLKEKKDYTVAYYTDEACTNALPAKYTMEEGKSQVVLYAKITGAGNYKSDSSKVVSFALYRAGEGKIDLSKARIVDPATGKKLGKQEYTGRAVTPAIKVQVKVGKTWTDVDPSAYNIVYSNNVEKGKATVVVSGKGTAATGSKAAVFAIKAKDMKGFEQGKFGEK